MARYQGSLQDNLNLPAQNPRKSCTVPNIMWHLLVLMNQRLRPCGTWMFSQIHSGAFIQHSKAGVPSPWVVSHHLEEKTWAIFTFRGVAQRWVPDSHSKVSWEVLEGYSSIHNLPYVSSELHSDLGAKNESDLQDQSGAHCSCTEGCAGCCVHPGIPRRLQDFLGYVETSKGPHSIGTVGSTPCSPLRNYSYISQHPSRSVGTSV